MEEMISRLPTIAVQLAVEAAGLERAAEPLVIECQGLAGSLLQSCTYYVPTTDRLNIFKLFNFNSLKMVEAAGVELLFGRALSS
jgi:hypothetical protein